MQYYAGGAGQEEGEGEMSAFEALQMEREAEFLGVLIDPLQLLPEEYAQYATNDLGDRLHQTVRTIHLYNVYCNICVVNLMYTLYFNILIVC